MKTYYNTTNESKDYVKKQESKSLTQEEEVYSLYEKYNKLSASDAYTVYHNNLKTPITSIRRAITNLSKSGFIHKTKEKKTGLYGKPEYIYQLSKSQC